MEKLDSDILVKQQETVETVKQASHFNVLQFLVKPPNHEVSVEVCLLDADGIAIGPARWVKLNPIASEQGEPPEMVEQDNWQVLVDMPLREINAKVKARLKDMEF